MRVWEKCNLFKQKPRSCDPGLVFDWPTNSHIILRRGGGQSLGNSIYRGRGYAGRMFNGKDSIFHIAMQFCIVFYSTKTQCEIWNLPIHSLICLHLHIHTLLLCSTSNIYSRTMYVNSNIYICQWYFAPIFPRNSLLSKELHFDYLSTIKFESLLLLPSQNKKQNKKSKY